MINVKKGPAHSLGQSDIRGLLTTGIVTGQICNIDTAGYVNPGNTYSSGAAAGIHGFAINNATDGDAIESNKIALYTLDGISIIETDQVDLVNTSGSAVTAITSANFPVGTKVYISSTNAGNVTIATSASSNGQVGWVEGVRYLTRYGSSQVNTAASTQNYTSSIEANASQNASGISTYNPTTATASFKPQVNIPLLSIKLASNA